MIKTWSFSRLLDFEQCPHRAFLKYVKRVPEPDRPLPPGKTEHANDRGTRIHDRAEAYVRGDVADIIPELGHFTAELNKLRSLHATGHVSLEGEWAFNDSWIPTGWMAGDTWLRVKLDASVYLSDKHAVVIDYKSGRRSGNEVKHAEQVQLYQLSTFMRDPKLETVTVELWYTDIDHIESLSMSRFQGMRFHKPFNERGQKMTNATSFPTNATQYTCKWCPYNDGETCTAGVKKSRK